VQLDLGDVDPSLAGRAGRRIALSLSRAKAVRSLSARHKPRLEPDENGAGGRDVPGRYPDVPEQAPGGYAEPIHAAGSPVPAPPAAGARAL